LNKYFPPDFDPSKIPRRSQPKNSQQVVRLMAPFSMRCTTCGEYIYKGKKFNARKETVEGETYFGIKIFRFYIKCTLCSAEITFKTDPKNTDYQAEHGAQRNFEPWRDEQAVEEEDRLAKLEEEENNPMKALENRTTDSKREMDVLDALHDIRARNARNERFDQDELQDILDARLEDLDEEEQQKKLEEEEDERVVQEVFSKARAGRPIASGSGVALADESLSAKRKADGIASDSPSLAALPGKLAMPPPKKKKTELANSLGIKLKGKAKAKA